MAGKPSAQFDFALPAGPEHARFLELLNLALRRIAGELERRAAAGEDLDMGGKRIVNLGDAVEGRDAVSRSASDRRYLTATAGAAGTVATTGSGTAAAAKRQMTLSVPGTLGIGSSLAPLAEMDETRSASQVVALVKQAPVGGSVQVEIAAGGARWGLVSIAAGATRGTLSGDGLPALRVDALVSVNVLAVPATFPGADLTVLVRFA